MAKIKRWAVTRDSLRPKPFVEGKIEVEGTFSWEEWMRIEAAMYKMLMQTRPNLKLIQGKDKKLLT